MTLRQFKEKVHRQIRAALPQAEVLLDRNRDGRHLPLSKPAVFLQLQKLEAASVSLGNYCGTGTFGELIQGRQAEICWKAVFCCPGPHGDEACGELLEALGQSLLFSNELGLHSLSGGEAQFRIKEQLFQLEAGFRCEVLLTQDAEEETLAGVVIQAGLRKEEEA